MHEIDRRGVLTGMLCGAALATAGLTIMPRPARSLPLASMESAIPEPQPLVEEARVTIHVHPRRHRNKRWRCWWHRGRRFCGWRW